MHRRNNMPTLWWRQNSRNTLNATTNYSIKNDQLAYQHLWRVKLKIHSHHHSFNIILLSYPLPACVETSDLFACAKRPPSSQYWDVCCPVWMRPALTSAWQPVMCLGCKWWWWPPTLCLYSHIPLSGLRGPVRLVKNKQTPYKQCNNGRLILKTAVTDS